MRPEAQNSRPDVRTDWRWYMDGKNSILRLSWKITSGGTHPDVQTDMPKLGRYRVRTDDAYYPGSYNNSHWCALSLRLYIIKISCTPTTKLLSIRRHVIPSSLPPLWSPRSDRVSVTFVSRRWLSESSISGLDSREYTRDQNSNSGLHSEHQTCADMKPLLNDGRSFLQE